MTATWNSQNKAKAITIPPGTLAQPGHAAVNNVFRASAAIHVWIPNQPHATTARSRAGTLAPLTPNAARQRTGNEMPDLVPAWALRIIGISTMVFPRRIVTIACHQFMPCVIIPDASV